MSVIVLTSCSNCNAALELECEGLQGFWGYLTYNEFFCPRCKKQNHARSPGAVVSARLVAGDPDKRTRGAMT